MKKSLLSVGAASMMLAMFATGCASGNNKMAVINDHFNNPPERYCIPVQGKEAEAAALDKKLAETNVTEIATLTKILAERAVLLEGRCKRLVPSPAECGVVAAAAAVTIDTTGIAVEDLAFRSSNIGKAYLAVYYKSEALKIASQKLSESGADAASVVASLPEDLVRDLASGASAIFAVLDPKQTVVTLQNIGSESVKSVAEITKLIPTLSQRVADLTGTVAGLSTQMTSRSIEITEDLLSKGGNPLTIKAEVEKVLKTDSVAVGVQNEIDTITREIDCLKKEIEQAKILLEYGAYIGKSCGYMVQAIQETNALSQAAETVLAKAGNAVNNND